MRYALAHRLARIGLVLSLIVLTALLAACGNGSNRIKPRVFAPTVSIQELRRDDAGQWTLLLRLQNFSNVAMRIETIDAKLSFDDGAAITLTANPQLSVPPNSAEPYPLAMNLPAADATAVSTILRDGGNLAYSLEGRIDSSEPKQRHDDFSFKSKLTPVPGISNTLR